MTNPYILHTNKIESASSISVTSEASGFEKEKAYDHRTSTFWKASAAGTVYFTVDMGSSVAVTGWGCYAQDLVDNSGTIELEYSATGAWAGEEATFGSTVTPTDNTPIMKTGGSQSARYWRFKVVSSGSASSLGVLWFGEYIETNQGLAVGFEPLHNAQRNFPVDSVTQDGEFVGRTLKEQPIKGTLKFVPVQTEAYIRGDYKTMLRAIEQHPFFVIPQVDDYPAEVYYCWTDKTIPHARYTSHSYLGGDIPIFAKVA